MALLQVLTVVSFHKYNPDWEIIVWLSTESEQELGKNVYVPEFTGKDCFDMLNMSYVKIIKGSLKSEGISLAINPIVASDIRKRNILYNYGGVYSDFDTIWLKPVDLKNVECIGNPNDFESIASFYCMTYGFHNVSNLIAEPKSGYIKSLIDIEKTIKPPYDHQAFGTQMLNNVYPTWRSIVSKFPRMLAIPYDTFYPYSTYYLETLFKDDNLKYITNNTLCVHWFNGNALAKDYINKEDYNRKCSMTSILKQYL